MLSAVMWGENIPENYYNDAQGKTGEALKAALHDIIDGHTELSYSEVWEALKYTDEDTANTNNVLLLYSGWSYPKNNNGGNVDEWNREHTWAKSQGGFGTSPGAGTDIHHLRPTDVTVNSARGNLMFDEGGSIYTDASRYGGGDGTTACKKGTSNWEPTDEVKGDVARMLFYMATRYESEDGVDLELAETSSSGGNHGKLSTLLRWHEEDPISAWEIRRNNRAYERQGNRNPFIDHPEFVQAVWADNNGGDPGEEGVTKLNMQKSDYQSIVDYVKTENLPNPSTYDDSEYYYGASAYHENYDIRSGKQNSKFSTPEEAIEESIIKVILLHMASGAQVGDNYTVSYKTYDGATSTSTMDFHCESRNPLNFATGHASLTSMSAVSENMSLFYPNPAKSVFTLSHSAQRIELIDFSGKLVFSKTNVNAGEEINLSNYASGVYLVKISRQHHTNTRKLIKH